MDINLLWKNTLSELEITLDRYTYQYYVQKTRLVALQGNLVTLSCPNPVLAQHIEKKYLSLIKNALDNQTKLNTQVSLIVQNVPKNPESISTTPLFSYSPKSTSFNNNLHSKYTFDNLIVGNSNNFAFAAAQGIVKNPGLSYNPFFIWGGVGVGKTHLMQAIGHELLKANPDLKVRYFPAETFGNELISALRSKNINQFKDKYRNADCILVDDVQFIAGKEYIQEEFFHTFNSLHLNNRQIVLTSDRKPSEIKGLEDRLVSRFMGGLTVDIQSPDIEMRTAIILQKTQEQGISISPDALNYLANEIRSNARDLQGRIQQIVVLSQSKHLSEINLELVRHHLHPSPSDHPISPDNNHLTPRHVISACSKFFKIKTGDLCGISRKKELVNARHFTAYLLLTDTKLSLQEVGRHLGGRDHTSIMHARDKIQSNLNNSLTQNTLSAIRSLF